ncbi:MAG: sulfatase [Cephaloticoccus sp.]|nr:sulfatase [Cephaloticoccus sp.]MCF7761517.1 sulfatase [Cephaloticoccus sp.]
MDRSHFHTIFLVQTARFAKVGNVNNPASRPNILFLVPEDMGLQLGCYGDPHARTPNIDELARHGVRFSQATTPYSICSPSRACALTGLYPHQNGHIGLATHCFELYRPDTPNIITHLRAGGYRTGIVGKLHVNPESAFPFDYHAIPGANFDRKTPMEAYVDSARKFWSEAKGQPWFLSVNFPDAHLPFVRTVDGRPAHPQTAEEVKLPSWVGADSPRLREETANYYNCIARVDAWIGHILAALKNDGQAENTMVIFMCDHGPQFPRGKGTVYQGAIQVPLIMRGPGVATPGSVRHELVSNVDLLPTVLQAARLSLPERLPGRPLQPLLAAAPPTDWGGFQFAMTTGSFPQNCFIQESFRLDRWKLIWTPPQPRPNNIAASYLDPKHFVTVPTGLDAGERAALSPMVAAAYLQWEYPPEYLLYDLADDPDEWHDLAQDPQHAGDLKRLVAAHHEFQHNTLDPFSDPANLKAFIREQADYFDWRYKTTPNFQWAHVAAFRQWRETRKRT